ncbi:MAG: LysE family translocator [Alphaproteobacteria bacterium]|nr:LysE family translocator [Alphaproteobacteria bacterium]
MTPMGSLAAFTAAATLVTLTPGLDTALVLRTTAAQGRRAGAWAAVGIALGCLTWGAAAALGLGALLSVSRTLFTVIRLAGAAYLVWLGVGLLLRPRAHLIAGDATEPASPPSPFLRGLATNLLNPKVGVFYVSFLPAFAVREVSFALWGVLLAAIHVGLGLIWFAILIQALDRARTWLSRPGVVRALDRLTGLVFLGFGAELALSGRG